MQNKFRSSPAESLKIPGHVCRVNGMFAARTKQRLLDFPQFIGLAPPWDRSVGHDAAGGAGAEVVEPNLVTIPHRHVKARQAILARRAIEGDFLAGAIVED